MATNTLTQNINQAINDFKGVRQALMDKGVEIPSGTPTSQYGAKIGEISGGGEQPTKGYQVTEWDSNGYPLKVKLYGMTEIPDYYFYCLSNGGGFTKLYDIDEWSTITTIGKYAFNRCTSLTLTSLPEGVTSIDECTFYYCKSLTLTSLPEGLTSIKSSTFCDCSSLALTSLPEGVTSIGQWAFLRCYSLTTLTIGSAIKSIATDAFDDCTNLKTIIINRAEGTVSGAPWGATNATVQWVGTN